MASFGWSAGDIIAAINLVNRIRQCLCGANDAREHFQELDAELQGLSRSLDEISALSHMPGQIPEIEALKFASCLCYETLQRFYTKIRPFEDALGRRFIIPSEYDWDVREPSRYHGNVLTTCFTTRSWRLSSRRSSNTVQAKPKFDLANMSCSTGSQAHL
jgi:hypothetical protein